MASRREEALALADYLLSDIELARLPAQDIAKKTSRLARLLDDTDALAWLSYEISGFHREPSRYLSQEAATNARRSNRMFIDERGTVRFNVAHLAELQSEIDAGKVQLAAAVDPDVSVSSANPSQQVFAPPGNRFEREGLRQHISKQQAILAKVLGSFHDYASARYHELRFGAAVEMAFEVVRNEVDGSIASVIPGALTKLAAAFENASSDNSEHWASAAATCRRLLEAVADALQPPDPDVDGRSMGQANYINRLVHWISERSESGTLKNLVVSDLEYLGNRLDAVADAGHKGAHTEVSRLDPSRFVTGTYLLLGDILSLQQT
jgi:hypothetical protein